jgi:hypothetical protein
VITVAGALSLLPLGRWRRLEIGPGVAYGRACLRRALGRGRRICWAGPGARASVHCR